MTTTYTPNIPQPTDEPSKSQDQILQNFQTIESVFNRDHFPFSQPDATVPKRGKHRCVHMPNASDATAVNPVPTVPANEGVLFTTQVGTLGSELIWKRDNQAQQYIMTGPWQDANGGYTTLFGGIVLQWGRSVTNAINPNIGKLTVTFPIAFNVDVYSVVATPLQATDDGDRRFIKLVSTSATNFSVLTTDVNGPISSEFRWIAIGQLKINP